MPRKEPAKRPIKPGAPTPKSVEEFLSSLEEAFIEGVLALREVILGADPTIAEGIKWNVPSFRTTEYFATTNMRAKSGIGVILHFGAKKGDISTAGVTIADPASLLVWLARDRAMVTFRDLGDLAAKRAAFTELIREWIKHV